MRLVSACAAVAVALVCAAPAFADDQSAAKGAPSGEKLRALCTDRPTKSTGTCTVDKGHWQIESDIVNVTSFRFDGISTTTTLVTSPVIKYGLTDNSDIELGFTPDVIVHVDDHNINQSGTLSGFGDLFLHWKDTSSSAPAAATSPRRSTPMVKAPRPRAWASATASGKAAWSCR